MVDVRELDSPLKTRKRAHSQSHTTPQSHTTQRLHQYLMLGESFHEVIDVRERDLPRCELGHAHALSGGRRVDATAAPARRGGDGIVLGLHESARVGHGERGARWRQSDAWPCTCVRPVSTTSMSKFSSCIPIAKHSSLLRPYRHFIYEVVGMLG